MAGAVRLEVRIGQDGKIKDMRGISSPCVCLTDATKGALSRWEFQPAILDGKPVEVLMTVVLRYEIGPSGQAIVH